MASDLVDFLQKNGLTSLGGSVIEEESSTMYKTGYLAGSSYFDPKLEPGELADILVKGSGELEQIDVETIAAKLWFQRELGEGVSHGTHEIRDLIDLEIARLKEEKGINREQALKYLREEFKPRLESLALERGAPYALDLAMALFKGKMPKKGIKPSRVDKTFSFSLDLSEFVSFINDISKAEVLKTEDFKAIKDVVFAKDLLSKVGTAVEDVIMEEYLSDEKILAKTSYGKKLIIERNLLVRYYSLLVEISTNISVALDNFTWFKNQIMTGSVRTELQQYFASAGIVERINSVLEEIKIRFNKYVESLASLSLDIKSVSDEVKSININKYTYQKLFQIAKANLLQFKEKIDEIITGVESFLRNLQGGSIESKRVIAGSSIYTGISNVVIRLRKSSSKIFEFISSSPEENIEEIKVKAGIAKLNSAYDIETKTNRDKINFLFSVSDNVNTVLEGLGMNSELINIIRSTISNYIFGGPSILEEVDYIIRERVTKNIIGAIT